MLKHVHPVLQCVLGIIPGMASLIPAFLFLKQLYLLIKPSKGHKWHHRPLCPAIISVHADEHLLQY